MSVWSNFDASLEEISRCVNHTSNAQLKHRMALVEMWAPEPGDQVLEVGCGQGDTTIALAAAVGEAGHVLAVDSADSEYGGPVSIGQAHEFSKASSLGERIEFRLATDLLSSEWDHQEDTFDLVVFSHSSWYMSTHQAVQEMFGRVRPWAKRLGYAEWDPTPRDLRQIPHVMATLLQLHIQTVWQQSPPSNVHSLILPGQARALAQKSGWAITNEGTIDTSNELEDGKEWEMCWAQEMAERLARSKDRLVSDYAREVIASEAQLMKQMDVGAPLSLSTYVFVAE